MNIRTTLKERFLSKNYYLTKASYHLWWHLNLLNKQPLIIYQMGKVGSTSIRDSLEALKLDMPVYQVHALTAQGIDRLERLYYGETSRVFQHSLLPETKHVFAGHFLRTRLENRSRTFKNWKIITLVRDPIARNISQFFYSVDTSKYDPHLPDFYERYGASKLSVAELLERFLERFHENSVEFQLPLIWFDTEFRAALGIDIYSRNFPRSKGYQIFYTEFADILILKLESLNQIACEAFDTFLGIEEFELVTSNAAKQKEYYPVYKSFIDLVNLPAAYIDKMYSSKYVKHFYSTQEIGSFWERWHNS